MNLEEVFDDIEQRYQRKVNKKQRIFCTVYASVFDMKRAMEAAKYKSESTLRVMIKLPHVAEAIETIHQQYLYKLGMSEKGILEQLINCAYADTSELYDKAGKLKPIHELPKRITKTITEVTKKGYKLEGRKEYIKMLMAAPS